MAQTFKEYAQAHYQDFLHIYVSISLFGFSEKSLPPIHKQRMVK